MNTKHDTRPTVDRIHADLIACQAARQARLAGCTTVECAQVYATAYAAALLEER